MTKIEISQLSITKIDREIKRLITPISRQSKDIIEHSMAIKKLNELKSLRNSMMETRTYNKMLKSLI